MINYYCPGFAEGQFVYKILFDLKENYPECFYDNVNISKIYGSFPNMTWNGGGFWVGKCLMPKQVDRYFKWYSNKNITLQLNLTNMVLEKKDLDDRYCNMILDTASKYNNIEILVSSPLLENYIRIKYPHMKINKSIIGATRYVSDYKNDSLNFHIQESEKYNKYVLPRKYSTLEYLEQIPKEKRDKFEVLVTSSCPISCPYPSQHYEFQGLAQLYEDIDNDDKCCKLPFRKSPFRYKTYEEDQFNYEQVKNLLEPIGFTEIKLSSRGDAINIILTLVPFLIKPNYQKDVYHLLLNRYKTFDIVYSNFN